MKTLCALLAACPLVLAVTWPASAIDPPTCTSEALGALVKLPPMPLSCENGTQRCRSDFQATLEDPTCGSSVSAYEKTLRGLVGPRWWSVPAAALEACRVHGSAGPLSKEEADQLDLGYGHEIQGDDSGRLVVLEDACGTPGISNVMLVVRTGGGLVLTPLFFAFNQGGTEDPFSLDVVREGADTFALFTSEGHDISTQYSSTAAYKVDLATGKAVLYPLFMTARGEQTLLESSWPIGPDIELKDTAMVVDGRFHSFMNYTSSLCRDDAKDCPPVTKEAFIWNSKEFVAEGLDTKRQDYLRKRAAQRHCLEATFDAKTGGANCVVEFLCERENDLAALSLKARNFEQARARAARALDYCRGLVAGTATARENYRQSQQR